MYESFTLAFSTGDNLDKGRLSGRVYDEAPAGVAVLAYDLSGLDPDTLDPRSRAPDYVIQTSESGAFRFTNMADGKYRILAVRDRGNNLRYDPETDAFGVAPDDVYVRQLDTLAPPVAMRLTMEDTTAPYLQNASAPHSGAILLRFSEAVSGLDAAAAKLRDSATGADIGIIAAADAPDARHGILLFSSEPMRSTRYFLDPGPVCDISGNCMLESSRQTAVEGVDSADDTNVRLLRSFPEVRAAAFPVDSPFVLLFSKPMTSAWSVTLTDSNKVEHPVEAEWTSPVMLTVRHARLPEASRFTLCADLRLMRDSLQGKIAGDTVLCIPFATDRPPESGAISGVVEVRSKAAGRVRVRARHIETNRSEITAATGSGSYGFPSVPPGRFLLDAFIDADDDGRLSHGRPFPFKASERFGAGADTVRVRSRWETRGANTTIVIP